MKKILLLLIIPFLFVGCSDDDVADDEINLIGDGSHEFEISGYLSISSVGEASFTHALDKTENTGPQSLLGINFYGNDEEVLITALIGVPNDASGVKAGTYTVQLENVEGETQVIVGMLGPEILLGTSGTITISEVRDFTVKGSIDAVIGNGIDNTEDTTIKGSFTAKGLTETLN